MEAKFIRRIVSYVDDTRLYKLSEPYVVKNSREGDLVVDHVVVSAVNPGMGEEPQTHIFPADENGRVLSMGELPGSILGTRDPDAAIQGFIDSVVGVE